MPLHIPLSGDLLFFMTIGTKRAADVRARAATEPDVPKVPVVKRPAAPVLNVDPQQQQPQQGPTMPRINPPLLKAAAVLTKLVKLAGCVRVSDEPVEDVRKAKSGYTMLQKGTKASAEAPSWLGRTAVNGVVSHQNATAPQPSTVSPSWVGRTASNGVADYTAASRQHMNATANPFNEFGRTPNGPGWWSRNSGWLLPAGLAAGGLLAGGLFAASQKKKKRYDLDGNEIKEAADWVPSGMPGWGGYDKPGIYDRTSGTSVGGPTAAGTGKDVGDPDLFPGGYQRMIDIATGATKNLRTSPEPGGTYAPATLTGTRSDPRILSDVKAAPGPSAVYVNDKTVDPSVQQIQDSYGAFARNLPENSNLRQWVDRATAGAAKSHNLMDKMRTSLGAGGFDNKMIRPPVNAYEPGTVGHGFGEADAIATVKDGPATPKYVGRSLDEFKKENPGLNDDSNLFSRNPWVIPAGLGGGALLAYLLHRMTRDEKEKDKEKRSSARSLMDHSASYVQHGMRRDRAQQGEPHVLVADPSTESHGLPDIKSVRVGRLPLSWMERHPSRTLHAGRDVYEGVTRTLPLMMASGALAGGLTASKGYRAEEIGRGLGYGTGAGLGAVGGRVLNDIAGNPDSASMRVLSPLGGGLLGVLAARGIMGESPEVRDARIKKEIQNRTRREKKAADEDRKKDDDEDDGRPMGPLKAMAAANAASGDYQATIDPLAARSYSDARMPIRGGWARLHGIQGEAARRMAGAKYVSPTMRYGGHVIRTVGTAIGGEDGPEHLADLFDASGVLSDPRNASRAANKYRQVLAPYAEGGLRSPGEAAIDPALLERAMNRTPRTAMNAADVLSRDAEIAGHRYNRLNRPAHYWLNPFVPGPLSEGLTRLMRRGAAEKADPDASFRASLYVPGVPTVRSLFGDNLQKREKARTLGRTAYDRANELAVEDAQNDLAERQKALEDSRREREQLTKRSSAWAPSWLRRDKTANAPIQSQPTAPTPVPTPPVGWGQMPASSPITGFLNGPGGPAPAKPMTTPVKDVPKTAPAASDASGVVKSNSSPLNYAAVGAPTGALLGYLASRLQDEKKRKTLRSMLVGGGLGAAAGGVAGLLNRPGRSVDVGSDTDGGRAVSSAPSAVPVALKPPARGVFDVAGVRSDDPDVLKRIALQSDVYTPEEHAAILHDPPASWKGEAGDAKGLTSISPVDVGTDVERPARHLWADQKYQRTDPVTGQRFFDLGGPVSYVDNAAGAPVHSATWRGDQEFPNIGPIVTRTKSFPFTAEELHDKSIKWKDEAVRRLFQRQGDAPPVDGAVLKPSGPFAGAGRPFSGAPGFAGFEKSNADTPKLLEDPKGFILGNDSTPDVVTRGVKWTGSTAAKGFGGELFGGKSPADAFSPDVGGFLDKNRWANWAAWGAPIGAGVGLLGGLMNRKKKKQNALGDALTGGLLGAGAGALGGLAYSNLFPDKPPAAQTDDTPSPVQTLTSAPTPPGIQRPNEQKSPLATLRENWDKTTATGRNAAVDQVANGLARTDAQLQGRDDYQKALDATFRAARVAPPEVQSEILDTQAAYDRAQDQTKAEPTWFRPFWNREGDGGAAVNKDLSAQAFADYRNRMIRLLSRDPIASRPTDTGNFLGNVAGTQGNTFDAMYRPEALDALQRVGSGGTVDPNTPVQTGAMNGGFGRGTRNMLGRVIAARAGLSAINGMTGSGLSKYHTDPVELARRYVAQAAPPKPGTPAPAAPAPRGFLGRKLDTAGAVAGYPLRYAGRQFTSAPFTPTNAGEIPSVLTSRLATLVNAPKPARPSTLFSAGRPAGAVPTAYISPDDINAALLDPGHVHHQKVKDALKRLSEETRPDSFKGQAGSLLTAASNRIRGISNPGVAGETGLPGATPISRFDTIPMREQLAKGTKDVTDPVVKQYLAGNRGVSVGGKDAVPGKLVENEFYNATRNTLNNNPSLKRLVHLEAQRLTPGTVLQETDIDKALLGKAPPEVQRNVRTAMRTYGDAIASRMHAGGLPGDMGKFTVADIRDRIGLLGTRGPDTPAVPGRPVAPELDERLKHVLGGSKVVDGHLIPAQVPKPGLGTRVWNTAMHKFSPVNPKNFGTAALLTAANRHGMAPLGSSRTLTEEAFRALGKDPGPPSGSEDMTPLPQKLTYPALPPNPTPEVIKQREDDWIVGRMKDLAEAEQKAGRMPDPKTIADRAFQELAKLREHR